ncbi:MAG: sensor histidine kinase [Chloroflexi bacterium]|nr:sensor histidine kinase [Chloroflexota bacterium]
MIPPSTKHHFSIRTLTATWPLWALLLEAVLLLHTAPESIAPTPLSLTVAGGVLLSGLLPALIRPAAETRLAAWLAILLASLLVTPFDQNTIPTADAAAWLVTAPRAVILRLVNGGLAITAAYHLTTTFPPRGRSEPHRPLRWLVLYGISLLVLTTLVFSHTGPLRLSTLIIAALWFAALLVGALAHLLDAARNPDPDFARSAQQARLLLLGFLLAETPLILRVLLFVAGQDEIIPYELALSLQVAVPISVAYATLRLDLFGIDAAIRRGLAYGFVFSLLLAAYLGLTLFLSRVLLQSLPHFQGMAILISLLLAAVIFRPLYNGIQRGVDRLFYPERLRFQAEMAALGRELQQVLPRQQVIHILNETLPARLDAHWGQLILAPAPDSPDPTHAPPAWNTRLMVGPRVLGRYWLGPRRSGLPYDASERGQLQALLKQAALALAYADTLAELNTLNAELEQRVALQTAQVLTQQRALAVTEERQRLARDLHDSVTQALFSISLGARALRKLALQDPLAAAAGLQEQEAAAQQALREMRTLLAQLRSPLLDDNDLVAALQQHCALLAQQTGLQVQLHTPEALVLPAEQANALFLIAREALHNVVKHGHTQHASCHLQQEGEEIILVIQDQGRGFVPGAAVTGEGSGLGLQNMQERAQNLGGSLEITSQPGHGTRLTVRLPLTPSTPHTLTTDANP